MILTGSVLFFTNLLSILFSKQLNMKDFLSLFASELAKKQKKTIKKITKHTKVKERNKSSGVLQTVSPSIQDDNDTTTTVKEVPKTLLQLNAIPQIISIDQYKNAHSSDNPSGDYKAAYRLSLLANSIPFLEPNFNTSGNQVSSIYGNLIESATSDSVYTQNILFDAQSNFKSSSLSGMGGVPEDWFPVNAIPSNWYDLLKDDDNLIDLEIDFNNVEIEDNEFITLNDNNTISWYTAVNKDSTEKSELHKDSSIKKIKLKILQINFYRPWLDYEVFDLHNWKIGGLPKGYFSNGKVEDNNGVFSLIPQTMLVGSKVHVEGDFHESDLKFMDKIKEKMLALGPFIINTDKYKAKIETKDNTTSITTDTYQVVGYLSRLVPYTPFIE